jgi:methanogenic corrinoid protein MtbC1
VKEENHMPHALFKELSNAVLKMDEEAAVSLSRKVLEEGLDAYSAIMEGLAEGMSKAGDLYDGGEYYVPELLLCADALYAGLDILRPHIKTAEAKFRGKVVIGVVEGDVHDIGKNLVKTMFEAEGWEVHDLGKDVKVERFAQEQKRVKANVVALSALMTTSMLAMPAIIESVKSGDPTAIVLVGGAPLSPEIAAHYKADGYADNAKNAVLTARNLLSAANS